MVIILIKYWTVPEEGEVLDGVGVVHVLALVEEARRMVPRVVLAWFDN